MTDKIKEWSGDLMKMRKADLLDIASDMGITIPKGLSGKYDVQDAIRDVLYSDESVRDDPRFLGLFMATKAGKRSSTHGDLASLNSPARSIISTATNALPSPHATATASARALDRVESAVSSTASALAPTASAAKAYGTSALQKSASYSTQALSTAAEFAVEKVPSDRQLRSLRRSASRSVIKARDSSLDLVGEAQVRSSEGWTIAAGLVALEVAFVLYANIGYELTSLGPYRWFLFNYETPARFFTVPTLAPLFTPTFIKAFTSYLFTTIALPLAFGLVLAFPQGQGAQQQHKKKEAREIAPPNAITFSVARLASVLLTGYIFQREGVLEEQDGFPEVAVLGSAVASVLTLLAAFYKK